MKRTPITNTTVATHRMARLLVSFIATLLVVMPWTEHVWHFDKFLLGGQDFEFGLLALASLFSLVLILSQASRQSVAFILAVQHWLSSRLQSETPPARRNELVPSFHGTSLPSPAPRLYNLPIQI